MPSVSLPEAVERIVKAIETEFDAVDLLHIYDDLLPGDPEAAAKADRNPGELIRPLVAYVRSGLEPVMLAEVWRVVFINRYRRVQYDVEDDRIHYRRWPKRQPAG